MKTFPLVLAVVLGASQPILARPRQNAVVDKSAQKKSEERLVFVTGSLIPQRVKVQPLGTATVSPLRVIDRHEIDGAGRSTTAGAFVNEPAVRVVGH